MWPSSLSLKHKRWKPHSLFQFFLIIEQSKINYNRPWQLKIQLRKYIECSGDAAAPEELDGGSYEGSSGHLLTGCQSVHFHTQKKPSSWVFFLNFIFQSSV
jgi:hypothetical protein